MRPIENRQIGGIPVIMVAVILATTACSRPATTRQPSQPTPTPTTAATTPIDDHNAPLTPAPTLTAPPQAAAAAVADAFAHAWVRTQPATGWWASVAPLCEPGLAQRLRSTDPGNVPATAVTGPPAPAGPATAEAATFTTPTDTGTLTVTVIHTPDGDWRVATIDFTKATRP